LAVIRILAGLLFFQHGAEKLWGFTGARIDRDFTTLRGIAGPLEVFGGTLLILGLFTRPTAFLLCGEMAVAYFRSWAPRGFFPIVNGGEEAVLFCYLFLWMVTAGPGAWALDDRFASSPFAKLSAWEPHSRSLMRLIFGFTFTLHGLRLALGALPAAAGRRGAAPMALDQLPAFLGYFEIAAGILLMLGLWARPSAIFAATLSLATYAFLALPNGPWPIRNGGNEVLLYAMVFFYIGVFGGGDWSLDRIGCSYRASREQSQRSSESAPLPR
jgi:putative oxidoreductase